MAWQTPKTNWQENNALTPTDFNRIEGNIQHLQDTKETPAGAQAKVNTHASSKQTHGISSGYYIAKTSRSDQLPAWGDIQGKPSLVTSSDLSNALAAKVDKPSSATSGNIAVFDGGAGKIKDGGKTIQQVSAPYYATGIATLSFTALTEEWSAAQYVSTGCSCVDVFIVGDLAGFTFQLTPGNKAMSIIQISRDDTNFRYEYISNPKYTNDILLASGPYFSAAGQLLSDGRLRIVARRSVSGPSSVDMTVLWRGWN